MSDFTPYSSDLKECPEVRIITIKGLSLNSKTKEAIEFVNEFIKLNDGHWGIIKLSSVVSKFHLECAVYNAFIHEEDGTKKMQNFANEIGYRLSASSNFQAIIKKYTFNETNNNDNNDTDFDEFAIIYVSKNNNSTEISKIEHEKLDSLQDSLKEFGEVFKSEELIDRLTKERMVQLGKEYKLASAEYTNVSKESFEDSIVNKCSIKEL